MARYAYYHPVTFEVIDWIDDSLLNVVLPNSVIPVNDEQWKLKDNICWICLDPFKIITTPPPGDFYILENDKWVYDKTLFTIALENTKAQVTQEIKNRRDEITVDYIIINNHHFHSDTSSRIQQLSLTKMGAEKKIPPGLMWKTKNNGLIELTNEIAAQFESVTMDHDMRLFANAQRHIAAVKALDDIQAVLDYDYSTGWQP
ncbi:MULTISPECIES: DUF4376 domain-containing protein [Escherichia]|uniref:DUF4376 domain-containing protein n=1 Tax=Escherichia TaxID=561 RepID=UPI000CF7B19D|nr:MULTISPECIES: DUF4376 domain-containing protein [unclassified Escherichia]EFB2831321.1 DUF4376 domain-containing protein [Escherichia coli]EFO2097830.1 DUF4376 domain-containing protein [Escherichia coli]MBB2344429.1 DUF4376 domain-containing protein [Escherichia sp. 93.0743]MBB2350281.1 DUF4376 domain-containing protein [Escherichia sp. 92.1228]MCF7287660.1 DUF4376 domain-containing protein [Escherichia coli]